MTNLMKTSDLLRMTINTLFLIFMVLSSTVLCNDIETLEQMVESSPENSDLHLKLGRMYQQNGLFYKAERELKKTLKIDKSNETAYIFLGELYYKKKQYSKASKYFKHALDINKCASYYNLYANALSKEDKIEQSIDAYKKALELDPQNPVLYYGLGFTYRKAEMNKDYGQIYLKLHKMDIEMARKLKNNTELFLFNSEPLRKSSK